ncbi:hypothetical protein FUA48_08540 [Flavobacterium alkalisoli]|uniref:Uncharacterized protein n=1 Tax=Flavobacterium alkalisoli TaxID=2602769 RepID=A0A5B9FV94_9FLAO|nr:hypothetical protein [Flavobacterium alkalisoli]QEE49628.1 hypothetical protein FUA48_08540 [Flavobacterium alkalisoli]
MSKKKTKKSKVALVRLSTQERQKRVWEALFYSHQRLDTLLIVISGTGIYVCLETIKFYSSKTEDVHWIIHLSAFLLLFAVITNFFSQWCASKVHQNDYCITVIDFQCEEESRERSEFLAEIQKHECEISNYEKINNFLTIFSILLMSFGLIGVVVFFIFIF